MTAPATSALFNPPNPPSEREEYRLCDSHGRWLSHRYTPSGLWEAVAESCPRCQQQAQLRQLTGAADIEPRFAECDFANYIAELPAQKTAKEACQRYAAAFAQVREQGVCLILIGRPGTGKNHLAVAMVKTIISQGYTASMLTLMSLIARIRATWAPESSENEEQIINKITNLDLLVIDEVGRGSGSENEKSLLFRVLDGRYRKVLPTILISNNSQKEIEKYIGAAAYDRLREGGGQVIDFTWKSWRGR